MMTRRQFTKTIGATAALAAAHPRSVWSVKASPAFSPIPDLTPPPVSPAGAGIFVTVNDHDGNSISSWKTVSHSTGMFGTDDAKVFEVSHTNVKGDAHCTFTEFLRIVDYEVVLDKVTGACA